MSVLLLLIGAERVEHVNPALALKLNPLDVETRIATVSEMLNRSAALPESELRGIARSIRSAIAREPVDARLRSLHAETHARLGEGHTAQRGFEEAHRISKTERLALRRLTDDAIARNDQASAVRYFDLFTRRWGWRSTQTTDLLIPLLHGKEGFDAVVTALQSSPPWRGELFRALSRDRAGIAFLPKLVLDLTLTDAPPTKSERALVVNALLQHGDYGGASRLHYLTLDDEEWSEAGHIFDGGFQKIKDKQSLGWQYQNSSVVQFDVSSPSAHEGLTLRFLDKPAREIILRQTLFLEPGEYSLLLSASAASLKAPRGLFWHLKCMGTNKEIARLNVGEGTYSRQLFTADFEVNNCPVQFLEVRSGLTVDSWIYRYSGRATFHEISIGPLRASG